MVQGIVLAHNPSTAERVHYLVGQELLVVEEVVVVVLSHPITTHAIHHLLVMVVVYQLMLLLLLLSRLKMVMVIKGHKMKVLIFTPIHHLLVLLLLLLMAVVMKVHIMSAVQQVVMQIGGMGMRLCLDWHSSVLEALYPEDAVPVEAVHELMRGDTVGAQVVGTLDALGHRVQLLALAAGATRQSIAAMADASLLVTCPAGRALQLQAIDIGRVLAKVHIGSGGDGRFAGQGRRGSVLQVGVTVAVQMVLQHLLLLQETVHVLLVDCGGRVLGQTRRH